MDKEEMDGLVFNNPDKIPICKMQEKSGRKTTRLYKVLLFVTKHSGCSYREIIFALETLLSEYQDMTTAKELIIQNFCEIRDTLKSTQEQGNHQSVFGRLV